jgi:uncharacterized protein affecting Mg2+/Co2+ transport
MRMCRVLNRLLYLVYMIIITGNAVADRREITSVHGRMQYVYAGVVGHQLALMGTSQLLITSVTCMRGS